MDQAAKFDAQQGAVRAVRFNKDGNYCVTCGSDKTVKLWNPYKQSRLQTYVGHSQEVLDVDCSHDHAFLCTGSADKSVFYFDVKAAKIVRKYRAHAGRVNCVRFNLEESSVILSGSIDGRVRLWDLRSKSFEHVQELDDCKDSVTYIDIVAAANHQILISCLDKYTRLYDLRQGKMFSDYIGYPVTCSHISQDNQCVLVGTLANHLFLFDKTSGQLLNEFAGHRNLQYNVESCLSNKCDTVYSGSEDGFVYVWDLVDAKVKQKLMHSSERAVHSLSYHPGEDVLLTAQEQFVYLWKKTT